MLHSKSLPVHASAKITTPLKVCIISNHSSLATGGLASYTRFLAKNLSRDCQVSAVARFSENGPKSIDHAAWEQPQTVQHGSYATRIIAPPARWRPTLGRLHHLTGRPVLRDFAVALYARAFRFGMACAIPDDTDVIHNVGNGWEMLGFVALAEARRRGIAFTVCPAVHPGSWGDGVLDIRLYAQADAVFVLSQDEWDHLARLGVPADRLVKCGLGPASEMQGEGERFRQQHGLGSRPLIFFLARKQRSKGYHALCEAMPYVLAQCPDACLVTAGPWGEPPYPPVAEGALLDLGQVDEQGKADALAACDVFCMPSESESFGIVYVEAWSYSKPVVGGPAPAVCELISDGENGLCVTQDPHEVADALLRLLSDASLRARMGAAGRALQQELYTWDAVCKVHKTIFARVSQERSRRPAIS